MSVYVAAVMLGLSLPQWIRFANCTSCKPRCPSGHNIWQPGYRLCERFVVVVDVGGAFLVLRLSLFTFFVSCCLILASCTPRATLPINAPIEVKITSMPSRDVSCWMPDIPTPPSPKTLDYEDENVMSRSMVHWLEFNALQTWAVDMQQWAIETQKCVDLLRGIEPVE